MEEVDPVGDAPGMVAGTITVKPRSGGEGRGTPQAAHVEDGRGLAWSWEKTA
jgi:hypothetical protein